MSTQVTGGGDLRLAAGTGTVQISAPTDTNPTGQELVLTLPETIGSADQVLKNSATPGTLEFGSIVPGISELDFWYLDSDATADGDLTDWNRNDLTGAPTQIGTGMSVSSGVFTFPSTGKWLVVGKFFFILSADTVGGSIHVSTDGGSNFTNIAATTEGIGSGQVSSAGDTTFAFVDVTSTANIKVKMRIDSVGTSSGVEGAGNAPKRARTFITFVRLGDT